jgi:PKD repeat protein
MKRLLHIFALIGTIALIDGCNEIDDPKPVVEDPFFTFQASIDGQVIEWQAGIDDYYLYTTQESDSFGVMEYRGHLRKENCNPCSNSLAVFFRGDDVNQPSVNSITTEGFRDLFGPTQGGQPGSYQIRFFSEQGNTPVSHFWQMSDGTTFTSANPVYNFTPAGSQSSFNVLHATSVLNDTCSAALSNVIELQSTCQPNFVTQSQGSTVFFSAYNAAGVQVVWNFGDGNAGYGTSPSHTYNGPGIYEVEMQVFSPDSGCFGHIKKHVIVNDTSSYCHANFHYQIDYQPPVGGDSLQLGAVGLEWYDESGVKYSSANKEQPSGSFFEMLESHSYLQNENNESTIEFSANVDLYLYSNQGDSVRFICPELHMAVPTPQ